MEKYQTGEPTTPKTLRERAETLLPKRSTDVGAMTTAAAQSLVRELQLRQIELELQNEELQRTQLELERRVGQRAAELMAANDSLRESRERLEAIVNTATSAIITIDEHGIVASFNPAAEKMFGYTKQEVIGQNVKMLMPPLYSKDHDTFLRNYLETGEAHIIGIGREVIAQHKDGTTFPVDLAVSEVQDLKPRFFTGILRNLSELMSLQKQVLDIAAQEQRRIGQDLHDSVGQELTGLSLMADTLALILAEKLPEAEALAVKIKDGLKRTLLHTKALSHGLIPVEVHAGGLMTALDELTRRLHQEAGIPIRFHCPNPVLLDDNEAATQLYRIAQEAMTNALRHAQPGQIVVSLEKSGSQIVLTVQNDGQSFRKRSGPKKGIGLQIMEHRARILGGMLRIQPVQEGGTIVTCSFHEGFQHE